MKIPKEKTKVRIKTDNSMIIGYVHTMQEARLSDFFSAHMDKFVPITGAIVCPLNYKFTCGEEEEKTDVMFINISKIEFIEYF
jgi:hypothetical protein